MAAVLQPQLQLLKWKSGVTPSPIDQTVWKPPVSRNVQWCSFWASLRRPTRTNNGPTGQTQKTRGWGLWNCVLHSGWPTHVVNAHLDELLDVSQPAFESILPSNVINAQELDFDEMDVVISFKMKNYKVHIFFGIKVNILRTTVAVSPLGLTECGPYFFTSSQMERQRLPDPQHVSQFCFKQPCHQRQRYAFCLPGRVTPPCSPYSCGKSCRTPINRRIPHRQVCQDFLPMERHIDPNLVGRVKLLANTRPHWTCPLYIKAVLTLRSILPSNRRIEKDHRILEPWSAMQLSGIQKRLNHHIQQWQTHLHGPNPKFILISNGTSTLREWGSAITRTSENSGR